MENYKVLMRENECTGSWLSQYLRFDINYFPSHLDFRLKTGGISVKTPVVIADTLCDGCFFGKNDR